MAKKIVRCPQCNNRMDLVLREEWTNYLIFDIIDGVLTTEGIVHAGSPRKIEAQCMKCGHCWTLRWTMQELKDEYPSCCEA